MSALKIARGLTLDPDYVGGGTFALLAKKGAGKTYTGRVMAEEFWDAKVPFVVLDPMGAWWGLRAGADGKADGIPIAIFGGDHADAPLERTGGAVMADLVVDEGLSVILDMSALGTRSAERQFALEFLDRLYRRNSELVHLFVDEADLFAPQSPQAGDRQLLGVTENIVRRGRNKGIGITLITQRPAVLNKDVLTQVDGLVAMRIVGLTDRKAIDEWVKGHGDPEAAAEVKGTLSGLENGECWWWVPELDILSRVQVRRSRTFDSSPTKKRGEKRRDPKSFADVDLAAVQEKMAATIERAKASDPKELRTRIRELEQQLAKAQTDAPATEPERVEIPVEVPVLPEEALAELEQLAAEARDGACAIADTAAKSWAAVEKALEEARTAVMSTVGRFEHAPPAPRAPRQPTPAPPPRPRSAPASTNGNGTPAVAEGDFRPSGPQQRILNALAALEAIGVFAPSKVQLALFAEASPKSSSYTNNLGTLRTAGLIDYPAGGLVQLADPGRAIADGGTAPRSTEELHAFVRSLVGPAKARLVDELVEVYPEALQKDELADRAGASATSSSFTNNLGSLRSLGLIDYPQRGWVAALPVLFLEGATA